MTTESRHPVRGDAGSAHGDGLRCAPPAARQPGREGSAATNGKDERWTR